MCRLPDPWFPGLKEISFFFPKNIQDIFSPGTKFDYLYLQDGHRMHIVSMVLAKRGYKGRKRPDFRRASQCRWCLVSANPLNSLIFLSALIFRAPFCLTSSPGPDYPSLQARRRLLPTTPTLLNYFACLSSQRRKGEGISFIVM